MYWVLTIFSYARQSQLHIQVCLCNIVRTVLEGKAVVTPVVEALSSADEEILSFLVQVSCCPYH